MPQTRSKAANRPASLPAGSSASRAPGSTASVHSARLRLLMIRALLFIAGAGILLRFFPYHGSGPELLTEGASLGGDSRAVIRGDHLYWLEIVDDGHSTARVRLFARPLRSNRQAIQAEQVISDRQVVASLFTEEEALLLLLPRTTPAEEKTLRSPGILMSKGTYMGEMGSPFRQLNDPAPEDKERREVVSRPVLRDRPSPILLHLPLKAPSGKGTAMSTAVDTQGYLPRTYALTPAGLYWVRPDTPTLIRVFPSGKHPFPRLEMAPKDTLMFTAVGGKPIVVKRNCMIDNMIYSDGMVRFVETGTIRESAPWRFELEAAHPTAPSPLLLPPAVTKLRHKSPYEDGPRASEWPIGGTSTWRIGARCYWLEWANGDGIPDGQYIDDKIQPGSPTVIRSARPDGSDEQLVADIRDIDGALVQPNRLLRDGDKLYLLFSRYENRENATKPRKNIYLARLDLDHPLSLLAGRTLLTNKPFLLPLEPVYHHCLYFRTTEKQGDLMDFLNRDSTEKQIRSDFRIQLPE